MKILLLTFLTITLFYTAFQIDKKDSPVTSFYNISVIDIMDPSFPKLA